MALRSPSVEWSSRWSSSSKWLKTGLDEQKFPESGKMDMGKMEIQNYALMLAPFFLISHIVLDMITRNAGVSWVGVEPVNTVELV